MCLWSMSGPFYKRFNIDLPFQEAQARFVNRIANELHHFIEGVYYSSGVRGFRHGEKPLEGIMEVLMTGQGRRWRPLSSDTYLSPDSFMKIWDDDLVKGDFHRCLEALENLHITLAAATPSACTNLSQLITDILSIGELDLGVSWKKGIFIPKGARLLDQTLVNDPLDWLEDPKYVNVLKPFREGLSALHEGEKKPERLKDAVKNMYEVMEALSRIQTGRSGDLAANREAFISALRLPDSYKRILKEYIDYGCNFRHAVKLGQTRNPPSLRETEAFVYLTGLLIRLSISPP